ncbi:cocaine- and amphetamine-regulated transcript protein [Striga asiatica]|uniref:Cocaine-and amphetamine-regulated transcript protein n=1 Tax=Striga asiatica TaxID=4170 RepID=A0A5A7QKC7_STRAF|nr:cocaine- and amphetamine-regulated transcript protein [Striga asiatica]
MGFSLEDDFVAEDAPTVAKKSFLHGEDKNHQIYSKKTNSSILCNKATIENSCQVISASFRLVSGGVIGRSTSAKGGGSSRDLSGTSGGGRTLTEVAQGGVTRRRVSSLSTGSVRLTRRRATTAVGSSREGGVTIADDNPTYRRRRVPVLERREVRVPHQDVGAECYVGHWPRVGGAGEIPDHRSSDPEHRDGKGGDGCDHDD